MWIVRLALRRPYTFVVMGVVIVLLGVVAIATTPTDIFPEIEIPVVSVIWNYSGLSTGEMASRITTRSEYTISSAVSDVRTIESQTYPGVIVIKIYFQPNVNVEAALAQVTAVSQTILRVMPPGTVPPFILQYNASSVPIIQLALSGKTLSEAELYEGASTLTIVKQLRDLLPAIRAAAPAGLEVKELFDPHVAGDPERARRDAQRDDARWAGAGGRHPRRRRHRGDREHPPQPGPRQASPPGDPRRRRGDRDAGVRLDPLDLHRLRARGVSRRPREVSLHAPRDGRRVRHAGLVPALAHDHPHPRPLPARERGSRPYRRRWHRARRIRPHP